MVSLIEFVLSKKIIKNLVIFVCCIFLSYIYVLIIPWELITGREFSDISNYLNRIANIVKSNDIQYLGLASYITNEFLWSVILGTLAEYINDHRNVLLFISISSLSFYLLVATKELPLIIIPIFFINPIFVDLIMSQVRIALAFSLLLLSIYLKNKLYIALICISAVLIHTSSILFISIFFIIKFIKKRNGVNRYIYIYGIILGLILSLFFAYGMSFFLTAIGDRRANYTEATSGSSILYSSFWFFLSLLLAVKSKIDKEKIIFVTFSITMMCIFFFSSVLDVYAQRFVAVSLIPILISINTLPGVYKIMILIIFFLYQVFQYIYWTNVGLM